MLIDFLHFYFNFILAALFHRYITMKLIDRDSDFGKSLAFIH